MNFKSYINKFVLISLLIFAGFQNYSSATSITAIASGTWYNSSIWSPAQVPGTGDDVTIGAFTVKVDSAAVCNNLTIMNNGTLTIDSLVVMIMEGNLVVNGTGSGNGAITGRGTFNLSAVNHTIGGTATISVKAFTTSLGSIYSLIFLGTGVTDGPAIISFTGDSVANVPSGPVVLVNVGSELTFSTNTKLMHSSYGYFTNYGLMTFYGTMAGAMSTGGSSRFINEGTIIMDGGATGTMQIGSSNNFSNNDSLIFKGTAQNVLTVLNSTTFINGPNAVINFTGTTGNNMLCSASGHFTNYGTINMTAGMSLPSTAWWINAGTINSTSSGTVMAVSINSSSYCKNLGTINSTGGGNISLNNNATFYNDGTVTIADSIIGNSATTSKWVQGKDNAVLNVGGQFLAKGVLIADSANNTVNYTGTAQIIKRPDSLHYDKLQISTVGSYAIIDTNITVNTSLILTSGLLKTGARVVIVDSAATISGGSSTSYVHGNLQKNFPTNPLVVSSFNFEIGDPTNYTPVNLSIASIATGGSLKAFTVAGDHPAISSSLLEPTLSVNRYWSLQNTGMIFTNADATFNWVTGDQDAGLDPAKLLVGKYDASVWTYPTVANLLPTSIQATAMVSFSDFAVAQLLGSGISTHSDGSVFQIYPNPSSGSFAIEGDNFGANSSIKIFDCQGKEVYSELFNESSSKKVIDLKGAEGIYFVKLTEGNKQYVQKIVIE